MSWKDNLTEWDFALCRMVASVTGKPCDPKNGGDGYFFHADYSGINTPEQIGGLWDAIEGMAGKRLRELYDEPDSRCLFASLSFAEEDAPIVRIKETDKTYEGDIYCHRLDEVRAVKVTRENEMKLRYFCGGGAFSTDVWHYRNHGVFLTVPVGGYIIKRGEGLDAMGGPEFEAEYERK